VSVRLKALEIEGFRGFAGRQRVDLDADVIVVRGDNGTGKTSVIDALLWVLCGEVAHLVERVRGLRRTEDAVISRFNPNGATVALTLDVEGAEYVVTRTGNQRSHELNVQPADDSSKDGTAETVLAELFGLQSRDELRQAVSTWGVLRQDAIRAALDAAGGALHDRLSGLIGLEKVTAFANATTRAADALVRERTTARAVLARAKERQVESFRRLDEARAAAGSPSQIAGLLVDGVSAVRAELASSAVEGSAELIVDESLDLATVSDLSAAVSKVVDALRSVRDDLQRASEHPADLDQAVRDAELATAAAEQTAKESAESAPALVQLASSAIGLLGDRCPVCGQPIDEGSVRAHLQEVLDRSRSLAARAQESQDALVGARAELARVRGALAAHNAAVERLDASRDRFRKVLADVNDRLRIRVDTSVASAVDALLDGLSASGSRLRASIKAVNEASGAHVTRLSDEADAAGTEVAAAEQHAVSLDERCGRAQELVRAAHSVARDILESTLDRLTPSFAEVFERLAPNPAFTALIAKQDVMRNRNQIIPLVRDRDRGIEANPVLVLSEGQLNVVGLSYFLGLALNAHEAALPFLVLDDPLQALDVIATLSFGDLCRQIREQRQLIVTTHDRRFADVLVRKLAPRDPSQALLVHEFHSWTRDGPVIETTCPEVATVMRLLHPKAS
jgi:DNA repair exonuclease SbcCD ATPase subunit